MELAIHSLACSIPLVWSVKIPLKNCGKGEAGTIDAAFQNVHGFKGKPALGSGDANHVGIPAVSSKRLHHCRHCLGGFIRADLFKINRENQNLQNLNIEDVFSSKNSDADVCPDSELSQLANDLYSWVPGTRTTATLPPQG